MKTSRYGLVAPLLAAACATSSHPTEPSKLGVARTQAALEALIDQPGPLEVETIVSCDWAVDRAGMINLEHPKAKAAGLEDGEEPVQVYFHAVRHPERGLYIIDTGVERALRDDPDNSAVSWILKSAMNMEKMKIHMPLGAWLERQGTPLAGVLLTHLHLDHILGLPDVPKKTPIYAGPGETSPRMFMNMFIQGTTDDELEGLGAIREWAYDREGAVDIFGDGSLWALWVPGHTPGSTAYLARTKNGPVLFTGDASHTKWGWEHHVEPGEFSLDLEQSAVSLARLEKLVADHPAIDVRLGHQPR